MSGTESKNLEAQTEAETMEEHYLMVMHSMVA